MRTIVNFQTIKLLLAECHIEIYVECGVCTRLLLCIKIISAYNMSVRTLIMCGIWLIYF